PVNIMCHCPSSSITIISYIAIDTRLISTRVVWKASENSPILQADMEHELSSRPSLLKQLSSCTIIDYMPMAYGMLLTMTAIMRICYQILVCGRSQLIVREQQLSMLLSNVCR